MYANAQEPTSTTAHELEDDHEIQKLTEELRRMEDEERWLDETIHSVENQLSEMSKDTLYDQFAYVTYEDIKRLTETRDNMNWTLLAIRAPKGTTIEIPEKPLPDYTSQSMSIDNNMLDAKFSNQIFLNSPKDEILVYMINNDSHIKQEHLSESQDEMHESESDHQDTDKHMTDNEKEKDMLWDEEHIEDDLDQQHGDEIGNRLFMFSQSIHQSSP